MKGKTETFLERNGEEIDVVVGWYANSPEPENNYAGGIEIDYVQDAGGEYITDSIGPYEWAQLEARIECDANEKAAEDRADYGDWLHDRMRDDRLTGDM